MTTPTDPQYVNPLMSQGGLYGMGAYFEPANFVQQCLYVETVTKRITYLNEKRPKN